MCGCGSLCCYDHGLGALARTYGLRGLADGREVSTREAIAPRSTPTIAPVVQPVPAAQTGEGRGVSTRDPMAGRSTPPATAPPLVLPVGDRTPSTRPPVGTDRGTPSAPVIPGGGGGGNPPQSPTEGGGTVVVPGGAAEENRDNPFLPVGAVESTYGDTPIQEAFGAIQDAGARLANSTNLPIGWIALGVGAYFAYPSILKLLKGKR